MLKFKDFVKSIEINESNVWRHKTNSYRITPKHVRKFPKELHDFTFIWTDEDINTLSSPKFYFIHTKSAGDVREISKQEAEKELKRNPKISLMKTEMDSNSYLIVEPDTDLLSKIKGSVETSTNIKEGMVVYFYYSDVNNIPNTNNFKLIIDHLLNDVQGKIPEESLDKKVIEEINNYLSNLPMDKKTLGDLIDCWSSADLIKNRLSGNSYIVSRNKIFNDIRNLGSKLTGFQSDKWCPGDIYLIDPSVIKDIPNYIKEIYSNVQPDSIERLNLLFRNEFENKITEEDPIIGSIIAISLKKEEAQGGKAKQFMKSLTKDDKEYNVTKAEQELPVDDLISSIETYRKNIKSSCEKSEVTIELTQETGYTGDGNEENIRKKFASIKLANKLLADPSTIDDNLLKSVGFGMSLTGLNPTFFKVTGNTKGVAKYDKFPAKELITLEDGGLGHKDSIIKIKDVNSNSSIVFNIKIRKGEEEPKDVQFVCRPNGNTQATLEIEKPG